MTDNYRQLFHGCEGARDPGWECVCVSVCRERSCLRKRSVPWVPAQLLAHLFFLETHHQGTLAFGGGCGEGL